MFIKTKEIRKRVGALSEMARWVKSLAAKPDGLRSISGVHIAKPNS